MTSAASFPAKIYLARGDTEKKHHHINYFTSHVASPLNLSKAKHKTIKIEGSPKALIF